MHINENSWRNGSIVSAFKSRGIYLIFLQLFTTVKIPEIYHRRAKSFLRSDFVYLYMPERILWTWKHPSKNQKKNAASPLQTTFFNPVSHNLQTNRIVTDNFGS